MSDPSELGKVQDIKAVNGVTPAFVADPLALFSHIQDSGRELPEFSADEVKNAYSLFSVAEFPEADGRKPQYMTPEQFKGLITLQNWFGSKEIDDKFQSGLRPESRLAYLVKMARRDLLTNQVSYVMGTVIGMKQLYNDDIAVVYEVLAKDSDDPYAALIKENVIKWGFDNSYELVDFTCNFEQFVRSPLYTEISEDVVSVMPRFEADNSFNESLIAGFKKNEAIKAVYTYFYLNRLFSSGADQQIALDRLGFPGHIKSLQLADAERLDISSAQDIGVYFSYLNNPFIRNGHFGYMQKK